MVTTNRIVLAGEVRCREDITPTIAEIEAAARETVKRIGYEQHGFHWQYADLACHLHGQSVDIAQGVDESGNKDEGAGDQGIMFGSDRKSGGWGKRVIAGGDLGGRRSIQKQ